MAPRKKKAATPTKGAKKRTSTAKKPAKKRASAAKSPARRSKVAATRGKPVTTPVKTQRSWRSWAVREGLTVAVGITLGLTVTGGLLWWRAKSDVASYLANPPRAVPGVVYSAPIEVRKGQPLTVPELAGDLLAAGYERVDHVDSRGQFAIDGGRVHIWTAPLQVPGGRVDADKSTVHIEAGRVRSTKPARGITLRPTVLATVGDAALRREPVFLEAISPHVEPAVLSMEDARFREHHGIDPLGIARAIWHNLRSDGGMHGGSTLTQQLAKNLFLTSERSMQRKVREAFFAAALESELSKDQLLELYLGEVYLGQVGGVPVHGVEAASRAWFGTSAARLSLGEAATLAGVIQAPNAFSPVRHPDKAAERRAVVLDRMVATGAISHDQASLATAAPLVVDGALPGAIRRAPWAVDIAVDHADELVGSGALSTGGWRVHTTLQPVLQRAASAAVREGLDALDRPDAQAALVAIRVSDGSVVAVVGGRDYATSPFNRAVSAWRQAGSTVKPLTLMASFDREPTRSPLHAVVDEPITIDGWTPRNYDGTFRGEISLRRAVQDSVNVPMVKLAQELGMDHVQGFYEDAGLSRATALPSASLGSFETTPWQMAGAYAAFPSGGTWHEPWLVSGLAAPDGTLTEAPHQERAIASARAAALATSVLEGVISDGTGRSAAEYGIRGPAGGKTGTTTGGRDAWFVGFTPELAVAVWVGNDEGEPLGLSGSRAALPIWSRFVVDAVAETGEFPEPRGVVHQPVCIDSHQLARAACPITYPEIFVEEHIPRDKCDEHGGVAAAVGGFFGGIFGGKRNVRAED